RADFAFPPSFVLADAYPRLCPMGLDPNLLSSTVAVLYMALISPFVAPGHGSVWLQSLTLGAVQLTLALLVNAMIVLAAGGLATFFTRRPLWLRAQRWVMGTMLAGVAALLVTDRTRPVPA